VDIPEEVSMAEPKLQIEQRLDKLEERLDQLEESLNDWINASADKAQTSEENAGS
jgi:hypothetical protein